MLKHMFFFFLLFLFSFSSAGGEITKNDLFTLKTKKSTSDFFELKKTVHLDYPVIKNQTIKTKYFRNFQVNEEYILGMDKKKRCWLWDINGKFISQVGNIGKGPGEYISAFTIALLRNRRIAIFDETRKVFIEYKIKNEDIRVIDTYDASCMMNFYPHKMKETKDGYIFVMLQGLKGGYKFIATYRELKIQKQMAKRTREAPGLCLHNVIFSEDRIIYPDDFIKDKYASSTLFVMDYDGNLLNEIQFPEKEATFFYMDEKSGLILGSGTKNIFVLDLSGRMIHKFKNKGEFYVKGIGPSVFRPIGTFITGDRNEKELILGVDHNDNLQLRINEIQML